MFLKWKTLIYSCMKLRHDQHCNATSIENGMKVVEQLFKFFVWIWCRNFLNRKNTNPERHLCMPLDLGIGQANSSLELSNLRWWLMKPKIIVPKWVSISHFLLEFLQWVTLHKTKNFINKIKFNECFPLLHKFRVQLFGQRLWDKVWCYWVHISERTENLGTHQKLDVNPLKTSLGHDGNTLLKLKNKNNSPPPPPLLLSLGEKAGPLGCMLHHLTGGVEFLFLIVFISQFFCLRLMRPAPRAGRFKEGDLETAPTWYIGNITTSHTTTYLKWFLLCWNLTRIGKELVQLFHFCAFALVCWATAFIEWITWLSISNTPMRMCYMHS
jgi:hypothetical protein